MREILFRGKQIDNGEWVEGGLIQTESWTSILVCIDSEASSYEPASGELYEYEVDPETVGQFTGLCDKNGKKIFEGDLVIPTNRRRLSNKLQVVSYNPISGYWQCSPMRSPKVVGNIYDNPELLKEGAQNG